MRDPIVLALSGGPGSTQVLRSLRRSTATVIGVVVDVGQPRGLESVREQAVALGAMRVHVVDARDEFLDRHALPALQAGLLADGAGAAASALWHPLVARAVCDVAAMEGASAVAHGAEAGSVAAERLQRLLAAGGFRGPVHAAGRPDAPAPQGEATQILGWVRCLTGAGAAPAPGDRGVYQLTRDPASAPGSASVALSFADGRPVAVNGVTLSLAELVEVISTIAGDHGVGRIVSTDRTGDAWRVVEAPAAIVLSAAFSALCEAAAGRDALAARAALAPVYRTALEEGRWHAPVSEAIQAFVGSLASRLSGTAHLDLARGDCLVSHVDVPLTSAQAPAAPHGAH